MSHCDGHFLGGLCGPEGFRLHLRLSKCTASYPFSWGFKLTASSWTCSNVAKSFSVAWWPKGHAVIPREVSLTRSTDSASPSPDGQIPSPKGRYLRKPHPVPAAYVPPHVSQHFIFPASSRVVVSLGSSYKPLTCLVSFSACFEFTRCLALCKVHWFVNFPGLFAAYKIGVICDCSPRPDCINLTRGSSTRMMSWINTSQHVCGKLHSHRTFIHVHRTSRISLWHGAWNALWKE